MTCCLSHNIGIAAQSAMWWCCNMGKWVESGVTRAVFESLYLKNWRDLKIVARDFCPGISTTHAPMPIAIYWSYNAE